MSQQDFVTGYIETMLWAETEGDDDGTPLCRNHTIGDLAPGEYEKIAADCNAFYVLNHHMWLNNAGWTAGHDYWLTRNGHGAGYWDGDYPANGDALTDAAKAAGEIDVYVGDNGMISTTHKELVTNPTNAGFVAGWVFDVLAAELSFDHESKHVPTDPETEHYAEDGNAVAQHIDGINGTTDDTIIHIVDTNGQRYRVTVEAID